MGVAATMRLDVGLGGSYRTAVNALSPLGFWPLGDVMGTDAEDASGNSRVGVYVASPSMRVMGPLPEGAGAVTLNGTTQKITVASTALNLTAGPLSVCGWVKRSSSSSFAGILGNSVTAGYSIVWNTAATLHFYIGAVSASFASTSSAWVFVAGTWDGTTGANGIKLYLNGSLVAQATAAVTVLSATGFKIGEMTSFFGGSLAGMAAFNTALSAGNISTLYACGVWTDITADTLANAEASFHYGIDGNGPADLVAGPGQLAITLNNSASATRLQGAYSPLHANKRAGWGFGTPLRLTFTYSGTERVKFFGKVADISPEPGRYWTKNVLVVAYDAQYQLLQADVREMPVQVDKTEAESISTILDTIAENAKPPAMSINAGLDIYPYSADDLGSGVKAISLIKDYVVSAQGLQAIKGDGTFIYRTRHAKVLTTSSGTFNETMVALESPSSLDGLFNLIRATIRPKTVDVPATTVLWAQTGAAAEMAPGEVIVLWGDYRNPADNSVRIGGVGQVVPLATDGTDYLANSLADGTGTNLTASLSVVCNAFGATAKFTLTNTGTIPLFRTKLQVRGRGVYDLGPQTLESFAAQDYGIRVYDVDLRYQDDAAIAQGLADYIRAARQSLVGQVQSMTFLANDSGTLMTHALDREIGDRITITETMTGLTLIDAFIQSVSFDISQGPWIVCTWGLIPVAAGATKILDDLVYGVLDSANCRLGYA